MKKFIIAVVVVSLITVVGAMIYIATLSKQEIVEYDPSTLEVSTDPVEKSMEFLPLGPVVFIDTAGINDDGDLGKNRIERTKKILDRTDIAIIVCKDENFDDYEKDLVEKLDELKIPYLIVVNSFEKMKPSNELKDRIYTSVLSDEQLIFKFKKFPYLGVWSKPEAPFVCIEPWFNTADKVDSNGKYADKENLIDLDPNEEFEAEYSVEFV